MSVQHTYGRRACLLLIVLFLALTSLARPAFTAPIPEPELRAHILQIEPPWIRFQASWSELPERTREKLTARYNEDQRRWEFGKDHHGTLLGAPNADTAIPPQDTQLANPAQGMRLANSLPIHTPALSKIRPAAKLLQTGGDWTQVGPEGGEVFDISWDANNPDILYGASIGGFYKTVDGGATWTRLAVDAEHPWDYHGAKIRVHPLNSNRIYATKSSTFYISNDGGTTWNQQNLDFDGPWFYSRAIEMDPGDEDRLFLAGYEYDDGTRYLTIARSTDGGTSWTLIRLRQLTSWGELGFLGIDPSNPDILYAGGQHDDDGDSRAILYKSVDGGTSWSEVFQTAAGVYSYPEALVIDPTSGGIFLGGSFNDWSAGLYRSMDGGSTWENVAAVSDGVDAMAVAAGGIVYAVQSATVHASADGGDTWTQRGVISTGNYSWANVLQADPANANRLMAGTYRRGFFTSTDGGETWAASNGNFFAVHGYDVLIHPDDRQIIYLASDLIYKTTDGGGSWSILSGVSGQQLAFAPGDPNTVYVSHSSFFYRSANGGDTWTDLYLPTALGGGSISVSSSYSPMTVDPVTGHIYVGGRSYSSNRAFIGVSENGGISWSLWTLSENDYVYATLAPGNGRVYVTGRGYDSPRIPIFYSIATDGTGEIRRFVDELLDYGNGYALTITPSGSIYIGGYGYLPWDSNSSEPRYRSLWLSNDGGDTWGPTRVHPGYDYLYDLEVVPAGANIFMACRLSDSNASVVISTDGGNHLLVESEAPLYGNSLALYEERGDLTVYAGLFGGGLYRSTRPAQFGIFAVWLYRTATFPDEPVILYANVRGENVALVQADIRRQDDQTVIESIELLDDGIPPDAEAGDGTYTGQWAGSDQLGGYQIDLLAENDQTQQTSWPDPIGFEIGHTILSVPENMLVSPDGLADARIPILIEDFGSGYLTSFDFLSTQLDIHLDGNGLEPVDPSISTIGTVQEGLGGIVDNSAIWNPDDEDWRLHSARAGVSPLDLSATTDPAQEIFAFIDLEADPLDPGNLDVNIEHVLFDEEGGTDVAKACCGSLEMGRGDIDNSRTIDAFDAALVLMHTVHTVNLDDPGDTLNDQVETDYGFTFPGAAGHMAEVSGEMGITAFDASLILRREVGQIGYFPSEEGFYRLWDPPTGWWKPPAELPPPTKPVVTARPMNKTIALGPVEKRADGLIAVPVTIDDMEGLLAGSFALHFDSTRLRPAGVEASDLTENYLFADHAQGDIARVGFAGAESQSGAGAIASVLFQPLDVAGTVGALELVEAQLNESDIDVRIAAAPLSTAAAVPRAFVLYPNYPNPFNPSTAVRYDLSTAGVVHLGVYDLVGQRIRLLQSGYQPAGQHKLEWNGADENGIVVASGVYLLRLETDQGILVRKMSMIK